VGIETLPRMSEDGLVGFWFSLLTTRKRGDTFSLWRTGGSDNPSVGSLSAL
jgi:hypothetical protein